MAAKQKRFTKLVESISALFGDQKIGKKLKKTKALERFIGKMEDKHREMKKELSKGSLKGKAAKEKSRQAEDLDKQIKKAKKILADMK